MALRVWLPLNGNLNNQGLSELTITNHNVVFSNSGKIGKAADFNGTPYLEIAQDGIVPTETQNFTCSYWMKEPENSSSSGFRVVCTIGQLIIGQYNNRFNLYSLTGSTFDVATSETQDTLKWTHFACTINTQKNVKMYVDGILVKETTATNFPSSTNTPFVIGRRGTTSTTNFNGLLNDFRLYDECLSPKQIKEISKGLVTHYPLKGACANPNLIPSSFVSSWSSNGSANTYTKLDDYSFSIEYTAETIGTAAGRYKGINSYFTEGKTYTFSYEIKGDGEYRIKAGFEPAANIVTTTTEFKRYYCTYTATTTGWCAIVFYSNGTHNLTTGSTITIRNMKLEEGNICTNYIPNSADAKYVALGYDKVWIDEDAGYGYEGKQSGTLSFNPDSPKYSGSTKFDSGYLHYLPSPINTSTDAFTFTCWFYPTRNATMALYNDRTAVGDGFSVFYLSGGIRFDTGSSAQYQSGSITVNAWNFVACTFDKINNLKKTYINGVQAGSTSTIGSLAAVGTNASIGNSSTNGAAGAGNQIYGSLSDVRIYATALSADEILTMYKNSGIIDNKGNVYTYEFKEE